ncbi:MAG: hypothetical protein ACM34H_10990 [Deltaproteobacteria bacterium]
MSFDEEEFRVRLSVRMSGRFRVWFVWILFIPAIAGCAGSKGAGLYEALPSAEKKRVLEEFKKNWQNYNVYCDGAASSPAAVIFDPKNDDRNLIGNRYIRLSKEGSVISAINWIEFLVQYNPLLYEIFDEEKNFYGYVLLVYHLPVPKRIDQKTLQLPQYESMYHGGGGGESD